MNNKIAFIGAGAMASAILRGACRELDPARFLVTDTFAEKAEALAAELGCTALHSNVEAARQADLVILCVKPQGASEVLAELAPILRGTQKVLCSILAGVTIETIRISLGAPEQPVLRIMPNTPMLIGKGQMLLCAADVPEGANAEVLTLLAPCGECVWMPEAFFDEGTALSGSSPAFVYLFINAMAEAGVAAGLERDQAIQLAARATYGAAAMVLETGEPPTALTAMVCSPGGSTIAGVHALEAGGFDDVVAEAIHASIARNQELGKIK
ncbi:MAG: pyrroline-5-carboxylate reductase [Oscillospiraceae bacterium]|nr:pyrroline-5-carboxylate reductase [Oscillospiraceae bacterium]